MSFIYLASPYSHPDEAVRQERWRLACQATVSLMRDGLTVFSPIVHCHLLALDFDLPSDARYWWDFNSNMLSKADALYILCIEGWIESAGVNAEREFASHIMPIQFVYFEGMKVHVGSTSPL